MAGVTPARTRMWMLVAARRVREWRRRLARKKKNEDAD
jgi:hypothetical protein